MLKIILKLLIPLSLLILSFIPAQDNAQSVYVGDLAIGNIYALGQDSKDNIYITRCRVGDSSTQWYLTRFDDQLNLDREIQVNGGHMTFFGHEIIIDHQDNIYIFGNFSEFIDLDPGDDVDIFSVDPSTTNYGLRDNGFVIKLDNELNYIWGLTVDARLEDIYGDSDGNLYVTGRIRDDSKENDILLNASHAGNDKGIYLAKINESGDILWSEKIGGTDPGESSTGLSILSDDKGFLYLMGMIKGTQDVDPGPDEYFLEADDFYESPVIIKLTEDGDFIWGQRLSTGETEFRDTHLETGINGSLLFYSAFRGNLILDFDQDEYNFDVGMTGSNLIILKLDLDGNLSVIKTWIGSSNQSFLMLNDVCVNSAEEVFLTGHFDGIWDFDPDDGEYLVDGTGIDDYSGDMFIMKLNSSLDFLSLTVIGGVDSSSGRSIMTVGDNKIAVSGVFDGKVEFLIADLLFEIESQFEKSYFIINNMEL